MNTAITQGLDIAAPHRLIIRIGLRDTLPVILREPIADIDLYT